MAVLLLEESVIVISELMIVAPKLIKNWSAKGSHLKHLYQSV